MKKHYIIIDSPIGKLTLIETDQIITGVLLNELPDENIVQKETPLLLKLKEELFEYFKGERKEFTVSFTQKMTPFQKGVYEVLKDVPYGYTVTYGDIAYLLNNEKSSRAVGNALGKNNVMILMPCHRVLGKNSLGGFSSGLEAKKFLLKLEGSVYSEEKL